MNNIRDYILVAENVLSSEVCDAILVEYANSDEWVCTEVKNGVNKDIRSAKTILMSTDFCINKNFNVRKQLDEEEATSRA